MNALPPLTYAQAHSGCSSILSHLGLPLFMGEAESKPTLKAVRKQVRAYYERLNQENKLDLLHSYDAENKAELIENCVQELLNQIEDLG